MTTTAAAAAELSMTAKNLRRVLRKLGIKPTAAGSTYLLTSTDLESVRDHLNAKGRRTVLAHEERTDLDIDAPLSSATLVNYWTTAATRNQHRAKWAHRAARLNQAIRDANLPPRELVPTHP